MDTYGSKDIKPKGQSRKIVSTSLFFCKNKLII